MNTCQWKAPAKLTAVPVFRLVLIFVLGSAHWACKEDAPPAMAAPPPPMVTVSKPVKRQLTEYAYFTGVTQASQTVEIRARVEGYITAMNFEPGQYVEAGDVLFEIDPKPFEARLKEVTAELASKKAALALLDVTYQRKESAFKDNAVSELAVLEAKAQRDQALADVDATSAMLDTARLNLNYTRVRAPISGRMGRNLMDEGNLLRVGDLTVLAILVKDDPIHVYFTVGEGEMLNLGDQLSRASTKAVKVAMSRSHETDFSYMGFLDYYDNRLDSSTGTLEVRAVFPNSDRSLMPGLFARLRMPLTETESVLMVDEKAVGIDQQGRYLMVVDENQTAQYRAVKVGSLVDGMRVVKGGIDADTTVIVNGLQRVRPGAPVTAQFQSPDATAGSVPSQDESSADDSQSRSSGKSSH